jgi:uncharacterized ion transporter superfamily protein YfcC
MKKYGLLKVIGISFLVVATLSWIIPAGSYYDGTFTAGKTLPIGLFDLIRTPLSTVANLIQYAMIFLLIGGLYGVLNKTGVYSSLVDSIVKKFKGKEKTFLISTMVLFTLLSSLTGLSFVIFILVPFFIAVLLSMHYNKKVALMATIGSMLVGIIGSTYGFSINGYINYYFSLDVHNEMLTKVIFLGIITFLSVIYVLNSTKKVSSVEVKKGNKKEESKDEEKVVIPLFEKGSKSKKSFWPLVIIMIGTIILLLVGMYNWQYSFGITFFGDTYTSLMGLEISGYPLVQNLIGGINPMGNWSIYEMSIILVMVMLLIGWIYNVKLNELIDSFVKGAKEMLPTAFYVTIANVVFVVLASSSTGENIFFPIAHFFFNMTENLNIVTMTIVSAIGSFFYNDFTNLFNAMGSNISIIYPDATLYPIIGMIVKTMYGLVMFVAPTSLLLVGGLSYLNVSYKEWFKYIWKFLLQVLAIAAIIVVIMFMFV